VLNGFGVGHHLESSLCADFEQLLYAFPFCLESRIGDSHVIQKSIFAHIGKSSPLLAHFYTCSLCHTFLFLSLRPHQGNPSNNHAKSKDQKDQNRSGHYTGPEQELYLQWSVVLNYKNDKKNRYHQDYYETSTHLFLGLAAKVSVFFERLHNKVRRRRSGSSFARIGALLNGIVFLC